MQLKFVYNDEGNITDVMIPIDVWKEKSAFFIGLEDQTSTPSWDPSPFFGSLKQAFKGKSAVDIGKDLRDEWERM
jgi:hypothetical protein